MAIAVALVAGVLAGVLIGWASWDQVQKLPDAVRDLVGATIRVVTRAAVPLLVLAVFAGILWGLVALAKKHEQHASLWAMGVAFVFLLGVSLLLYTTGSRRRTARWQIALGGEEAKAIAANGDLTAEEYARLPNDARAKVQTRYKATKQITLPKWCKRFEEGQILEQADYEALPADARKKVADRYVTKHRVAWSEKSKREPDSEPAGTEISKKDNDTLSDAQQLKVRLEYRAEEQVTAETGAHSVAEGELVPLVDVVHHLELVQSNAKRVYLAKQAVAVPAVDAKVIEKGSPVDRKTFALLDPERRAAVETQRGLYFRGLYVGADGRWSTSKLQVLLWTYAVLFGLAALFVFNELLTQRFDIDPSSKEKLGDFGDMQLQEQYLLLLGGPFAAAVIAKASTQSKVSGGTLVKPPDPVPAGPVDGLREVISNDAGQTDVMDFQYFFFNVLALAVFAVTIASGLDGGMPVLPWFLVGLTSTSALAYSTKKSLDNSVPQITGVVPEHVRPGGRLTIEGRNLVAATRRAPAVSIAGLPVPEADVEVTGGTAQDDIAQITITVPPTTKPSEDARLAVVPEGSAAGAERAIDVLGPQIDQVQPGTIPAVPGARVLVFGEGFGEEVPREEEVSATAGTLPLTADLATWSDTQLTFTVGAVSAIGAQRSGAADLSISIKGVGVASTPVKMVSSAGAIEKVIPETIRLSEHVTISVVGTGFGDDTSKGKVQIEGWELEDPEWSDSLVRGALKLSKVPAEYAKEKTVPLLVIPKDRPPIVTDVKVRK